MLQTSEKERHKNSQASVEKTQTSKKSQKLGKKVTKSDKISQSSIKKTLTSEKKSQIVAK